MKKIFHFFLIVVLIVVAGIIIWFTWSIPKFIQEKEVGNVIQTVHKVVKGNSLFSLSRKYIVNIEDIRKVNGFPPSRDLLSIGQTLLIPIPKVSPYEGIASWYGPGFHGKKMANGEVYNQNEILVAHRDWPLGIKVLVVNLENHETSIATVKDRGPYPQDEKGNYTRDIDCSKALAVKLGFLKEGLAKVRIVPLSTI